MRSGPILLSDYLRHSGNLIERYRRAGKSIHGNNGDPQFPSIANIIAAGRNMAAERKMTRAQLNEFEMEGEREGDIVHAPIRVRAVFAYYDDPFEDIPAHASYLVRESNHPNLPEKGNVGAEDLLKNGVGIPFTPTYATWIQGGRKCVRK